MISGIGFLLMVISMAVSVLVDDMKRSSLLTVLGVHLVGLVLLAIGILCY